MWWFQNIPKAIQMLRSLGTSGNSDRRNCYLQFSTALDGKTSPPPRVLLPKAPFHREKVPWHSGDWRAWCPAVVEILLEGAKWSIHFLKQLVICRDAIGKPFFHMGSLQDGGGPQERGNRRGNPHLNTPTSPPMASNAHHISAAMLSSVLYSPQTWQSSLTGWWMHMFHWGITNSDRDLKTVQEIKESRSSQHG